MSSKKRAVVLFSGGLDSTTCLALAISQGFECVALSFDYGQRHVFELQAAKRMADSMNVEHRIVKLDIASFGQSALTDTTISVPDATSYPSIDIPVTYVPARNTLFLATALGLAEAIEAEAIFIGVSAVDYSGYPDCRPEYIAAFQTMANLATKQAIQGRPIHIEAPLIHLSKAETIQLGLSHGVQYAGTVSCYKTNEYGEACGQCDSCALRRKGFHEAGVIDPTRYQ